jgi:SHS2 domain-containing protein
MGEGFRTFDHTGDLGLEVWAKSPERLHALAAEALLAQVVEVRDPAPEVTAELRLDASDPADLLVHWLNTALLESEIRRGVWTRARVWDLGERSLAGRLEGPRLDLRRQTGLREIKGVTHHHLELRLEPPDCRCRLILDL